MTEQVTKWQLWMRSYSAGLKASFLFSKAISHNVTKGSSRENQVLDFFEYLLPQRITVGRNVVVIDSNDVESPKFDGVFVDRANFPALYGAGDILISMVEGVIAALEIKSNLDQGEIVKIFGMTSDLRALKRPKYKEALPDPPVISFAYECANRNLSFFDFSASFWAAPETSPSAMCILDDSVFVASRMEGGRVVFPAVPTSDALPALLRVGEDALLVFLYLVSSYVSGGSSGPEAIHAYSQNLLSEQSVFFFDRDFLTAIAQDSGARDEARAAFLRGSGRAIADLYADSRARIGLHPL